MTRARPWKWANFKKYIFLLLWCALFWVMQGVFIKWYHHKTDMQEEEMKVCTFHYLVPEVVRPKSTLEPQPPDTLKCHCKETVVGGEQQWPPTPVAAILTWLTRRSIALLDQSLPGRTGGQSQGFGVWMTWQIAQHCNEIYLLSSV